MSLVEAFPFDSEHVPCFSVRAFRYPHTLKLLCWFSEVRHTTDRCEAYQKTLFTFVDEAHPQGEQILQSMKAIFYGDKWFNIFLFLDHSDRPQKAYCNIATPAVWSETELSFIDLDLDVVVDEHFQVTVLDEEEFARRQQDLQYPPSFVIAAQAAVAELQHMVAHRQEPFTW